MPKLTVNGVEVEVPPGSTVLQACELAPDECWPRLLADGLARAEPTELCRVLAGAARVDVASRAATSAR